MRCCSKTHFWDDFADSQFRRLQRRARPGRIFIVVDETRGPRAGILHGDVVRMTEYTSEAGEYLRHPDGNVFWYNTDYQIYHFLAKFPLYE